MMDHTDHVIVRYCGTATEVGIPEQIERIGDFSFAGCDSITSVRFESVSKLSSIGREAFWHCRHLTTIAIPSPVQFLGERCFRGCSLLETVSFCAGSRLDCVPEGAFADCYLLESITLPLSVKRVGDRCFFSCSKLVNSPFPPNSELVAVGDNAFECCSSLAAMVLPSSVEFVGDGAFACCLSLESMFLPSSVEYVGAFCFETSHSLSHLTFSAPSHIRELLDLPPELSGLVSIPDSVEVLSFYRNYKGSCEWTLSFGIDSRLREIRPASASGLVPAHEIGRSFLQVSTRSLKFLRANLEFKSST
jgi:hypothetical protein